MLKVRSDGGFFSTCSVRLVAILSYFNEHRALPSIVDSSEQFTWYKSNPGDITFTYFVPYDRLPISIPWTCHIEEYDRQYLPYKELDYDVILPFITKYYTPNEFILKEVERLEREYSIDYENTCALFYRGNDKITEVSLSTYDDVIEKAEELLEIHPTLRFLIQSDETEFIEEMQKVFASSFWFENDTRHMTQRVGTVDLLMRHNIHSFSQRFLAITIIMSKCKYVVCGTGNCPLWIAYYRGHANGMYQYLHDTWV
jgi:hypothetical protein